MHGNLTVVLERGRNRECSVELAAHRVDADVYGLAGVFVKYILSVVAVEVPGSDVTLQA